jgi:hypothetical protein
VLNPHARKITDAAPCSLNEITAQVFSMAKAKVVPSESSKIHQKPEEAPCAPLVSCAPRAAKSAVVIAAMRDGEMRRREVLMRKLSGANARM